MPHYAHLQVDYYTIRGVSDASLNKSSLCASGDRAVYQLNVKGGYWLSRMFMLHVNRYLVTCVDKYDYFRRLPHLQTYLKPFYILIGGRHCKVAVNRSCIRWSKLCSTTLPVTINISIYGSHECMYNKDAYISVPNTSLKHCYAVEYPSKVRSEIQRNYIYINAKHCVFLQLACARISDILDPANALFNLLSFYKNYQVLVLNVVMVLVRCYTYFCEPLRKCLLHLLKKPIIARAGTCLLYTSPSPRD